MYCLILHCRDSIYWPWRLTRNRHLCPNVFWTLAATGVFIMQQLQIQVCSRHGRAATFSLARKNRLSSKTAGAVESLTCSIFKKTGASDCVSQVQAAIYGKFVLTAKCWALEISLELGNLKMLHFSVPVKAINKLMLTAPFNMDLSYREHLHFRTFFWSLNSVQCR